MQNTDYKSRKIYSYDKEINYVCNNVYFKAREQSGGTEQKRTFKRKKISRLQILSACFIWSIVLFAAFSINKSSFLDPVYFNRLNNKKLDFNTKTVYAPTLNYLNNLNILGTNVLAPVSVKNKGKIIPINSSGELTGLKNKISSVLNNYKKLHAGIFIYDYYTGKTVDINKDEIFPAASIIKIPVLLNFFNRNYDLEKEGFKPVDINKKLTFTEAHRTEGSGNLQFKSADIDYTIDYLAKIMITKSDNSATNMLVEETGGINEVNSSLRNWGFSKTQMTSWLPDLKGSNTTTPVDIATMLYNVDNRKFLSLQSAANIKEYMSQVENRTLIKSQLPKDAIIMHKTGDIGTMLGDAGIIYSPSGKKFITVIMVKRPHNDYHARELIQKISKIVYDSLS